MSQTLPVLKSKAPPLSGRDRIRMISTLSDNGVPIKQIAAQLGISKQRVVQIASRHAIPIGKQGGTGRIGAWVPRRLIASIGDLANDAGCSRSALLGRVIEAVFADKAMATKLLGKAALPVRGYRAGDV